MNAKLKRLVIALVIALVILSIASTNMKRTFSNETNGRIDLFTQKEPYSGKGPNAMSDAFGFGENVQIYALATYNDEPAANILVSFKILGPPNSFENFTLYRTATTDKNGSCAITFRTPYSPETALGEWTVSGNARILNSPINDTVSFKVGWIVEIISLDTINQSHILQETFTRGSYLGVKIGLQSISMTPKTSYLTAAACDALNNPINSTDLSNFVVPPNETTVYVDLFLFIPANAHLGIATVYANAYTSSDPSNRLPYCPEASKQFSIVARTYFLTVATEPTGIATILGEGLYEENTNVTLTAPASVPRSTNSRYVFSYWSVDGISQSAANISVTILMDANHTAAAHYVLITTYTLTIKTSTGGTTNPVPGTYNYSAGISVQVSAIWNQNYIFSHWELDNVSVGSTNPYNITMDRDRTLKAVFASTPAGFFIPDWFFWPFLPLLILMIFLLIILIFYERRRRRSEAAFYSGWTAWYYGYDLRNRNMRFRRKSR